MHCCHIIFTLFIAVHVASAAHMAPTLRHSSSHALPTTTTVFDNVIRHNEAAAKETTIFDAHYNRTFGTFTAIAAAAEPTSTLGGQAKKTITERAIHHPQSHHGSVNSSAVMINGTWISLNHTNIRSILAGSFSTEPKRGPGKYLHGNGIECPASFNKQLEKFLLESFRGRMPLQGGEAISSGTPNFSTSKTVVIPDLEFKVSTSTAASKANPIFPKTVQNERAHDLSMIPTSTPGDVVLGHVVSSSTADSTMTTPSPVLESYVGFIPGTACEREGLWHCSHNRKYFQRCGSGTWSPILLLAEGTTCPPGHVKHTHGMYVNAAENSKRSPDIENATDKTKLVESRVITPNFRRPEVEFVEVRKTINHAASLLARDLTSHVVTRTESTSTPQSTHYFPGFPIPFEHGPVVPGRAFRGHKSSCASDQTSVIATPTSLSILGFPTNFGLDPVDPGKGLHPTTLRTVTSIRTSSSFPDSSAIFGHGPVVPGKDFHSTNHTNTRNSTRTLPSRTRIWSWHKWFGHGPVVVPGLHRPSHLQSNTSGSVKSPAATSNITSSWHKWFGHGPVVQSPRIHSREMLNRTQGSNITAPVDTRTGLL